MSIKPLLVLSILSICLFTGCKRKDTSVVCSNASIVIFGVGFPPPDTLADVFRYKRDNAFDSLIDSIQYTHFSFDTVYWPALQSITLQPGYDYKLKLLGTNTSFSFSKITNGSHHSEEMAAGTGNTCYDPIISYMLNDSTVHVKDTTETHGPLTLYLYK